MSLRLLLNNLSSPKRLPQSYKSSTLSGSIVFPLILVNYTPKNQRCMGRNMIRIALRKFRRNCELVLLAQWHAGDALLRTWTPYKKSSLRKLRRSLRSTNLWSNLSCRLQFQTYHFSETCFFEKRILVFKKVSSTRARATTYSLPLLAWSKSYRQLAKATVILSPVSGLSIPFQARIMTLPTDIIELCNMVCLEEKDDRWIKDNSPAVSTHIARSAGIDEWQDNVHTRKVHYIR